MTFRPFFTSTVFLIFSLASSLVWAGTCQVLEDYKEGYVRNVFDQSDLNGAKTLEKCKKVSRQSSFRNRFVLVFKSESQREYEILNGAIRGFSSSSIAPAVKSRKVL